MEISKKTLTDLEFQRVIEDVLKHCKSDLAKKKIQQLQPIENKKRLVAELKFVNEFLASFENENTFPSVEFDEVTEEIRILNIEDSFLEADSCLKIKRLSERANENIQFVEKFKEYYPTLHLLISKVPFTKEIIKKINKVFNRFGEIKDDSTPLLKEIRNQIISQNRSISDKFRQELKKYGAQDYLDSIQESVIDNKRVLAVKSANKKRIPGVILGQSKTGSIVFIEPDSMIRVNRALQQLKEGEREEEIKVLKALSEELRENIDLFGKYQSLLAHLDFVRAKSLYAKEIDAILPKINQRHYLKLINAYHPILYKTNRDEGKETIPQNIELNTEQRIITISGPNAGGKSISLKTIGLLQVMIQSGLLIPVHFRSSVCFYDKILTDIGDNQSIENHLSTYSYRLKQMRTFLKKCDEQTLFLIDEFGTGSDPELGGALAEVFLEEFYECGATGVLTTHYTNIKLKVEELPHAINACMLFDEKTLEPLYVLEIGQAGSSFTFEVAQKNGIPFSLLNRAKKKVEKDTVRLDKTMVKLQQEKFRVEKSKKELEETEQKVARKHESLGSLQDKVETKLHQYQEAFDRNQKYISLGKKIAILSEKYFYNKRKKDLMKEVLRIVEMENAKRKKETKKETKKRKEKENQTDNELKQKLMPIREKKKSNEIYIKELKNNEFKNYIKTLTIGNRVKIKDGTSIGTIEKIEKKIAFVNFGIATMKVALQDLKKVN
ncbi:MAG: endonuclease MutS2 [Flavobacteriales bacterium]